MGRTYQWRINPFQDYLFWSLLHGTDIANKDLEADVYVAFVTILDYMMHNKTDSEHLDFEIKKKDGYFKVVAKNSITAFWLSGIFPKNVKQVLDTNEYKIDDIKYKYNLKTKKLTYRQLKK